MVRKRPRAKTKTVLKPVKQWEQHGNMPNWKSKCFMNKNHPLLCTLAVYPEYQYANEVPLVYVC